MYEKSTCADKVKLSSFGGESSIRKSGSMGNKIVQTLTGYFLTRTFLCHFCIPSMPRCIFSSLHSCAKKKKHECLLREEKETRVLVTLITCRQNGRGNIPTHNHTGISVEVRMGIISNLNLVLIYHSGLQQVKNTAN